MQLRIIYNFLLFTLIFYFDYEFSINKNTKFLNLLITNSFIILILIIHPGFIFLLCFYFLRNFIYTSFTQKIKILFTFIITVGLFSLILYLVFELNEFKGIYNHYYNYFYLRDTLPNIGVMWILFPSVNNFFK